MSLFGCIGSALVFKVGYVVCLLFHLNARIIVAHRVTGFNTKKQYGPRIFPLVLHNSD